MHLNQHPLSAAFPAMAEDDLAALAADIKTNGLRHPVVLWQGQVLDGWHRFAACKSAGVEARTVQFDGADPVAYVLSVNLARRHLTPAQRAHAVVACSEWRGVGRSNSARVRNKTTAEMAHEADVSPRTIENVKAGIKAGKGEAIRSGELSAKAAAAPDADTLNPHALNTLKAAPDALAADYTEEDRRREYAADFEAMAQIIDSDDKLASAVGELRVARRHSYTLERLCDDKTRELEQMKREAARWMRKAKKSAACQDCMTALERP